MTHPIWTETEIDRVRSLWAHEKTASEISRIMRRSRNAVIGIIYRNGLHKGDHAAPLYSLDAITEAAAEVWDCTVEEIHLTTRRPVTPQEIIAMRARQTAAHIARKSGHTFVDMARHYDIDVATAARRARVGGSLEYQTVANRVKLIWERLEKPTRRPAEAVRPKPIKPIEHRPGMCRKCAVRVAVQGGECRECRLSRMPKRTREVVIGGHGGGASSLV